jgi:predicted nucleotidyltransferase component of viral defense system
MIHSHSYSRDWLDNLKAKYNKINPPLLEKMIRALGLVELLKYNSLDFVFKGGTSLILHFADPKRFSIDIDIITKETENKIETVLNTIISSGHPFIRLEKNERESNHTKIPKAHYKLFYLSEIDQNEQYILLDIVFTDSKYPVLKQVEITTNWVKVTDENVKLDIPSVDSITGDKLTAFAPNTSGILYKKGKELEIIKQLFDLGNLFDFIENFNIVAESYKLIIEDEIIFRGNTFSIEQAIEDTYDTCLLISTGNKLKKKLKRKNTMN